MGLLYTTEKYLTSLATTEQPNKEQHDTLTGSYVEMFVFHSDLIHVIVLITIEDLERPDKDVNILFENFLLPEM